MLGSGICPVTARIAILTLDDRLTTNYVPLEIRFRSGARGSTKRFLLRSATSTIFAIERLSLLRCSQFA